MASIGYARTSTIEQEAGLEAQKRDLLAAGVEPKHLYTEQISSLAERAALKAALAFARAGDTFTVTKPDRLARSTVELLTIVEGLEAKKVGVKILSMGMDLSTPTGKLMLSMLASVATFERDIMLERQREGVAVAKAAGKYKGRPLSVDPDAVKSLYASGYGPAAVARLARCSVATVYRILKLKDKPVAPRTPHAVSAICS
jgi:DNA invertase Pin-like site-specific DNA recombinase